MKRGFAWMAALLLVLGLLSGCGGSGGDTAASSDTAASEAAVSAGANGSGEAAYGAWSETEAAEGFCREFGFAPAPDGGAWEKSIGYDPEFLGA